MLRQEEKKGDTLTYLCRHNYNTVVQVVYTFTLTLVPQVNR
jgi:hypothetical protein